MWQQLLYPPIFCRFIDISLSFLFGWTSKNISTHQKLAAYPHLYSYTSTKCVVHWFQIIRHKSFQMYDDEIQNPLAIVAGRQFYKVAKFPTRNIKTPIVLVYGGSDGLIDIKAMLKELPRHTTAIEIPHFEHLDFLWGNSVDDLVHPHVFAALDEHAGRDHSRSFPPSTGKFGHHALAYYTKYSEDNATMIPDTDVVRTPLRSALAALGASSLPKTEQGAMVPPSGSPVLSLSESSKESARQRRSDSMVGKKNLDSIKRFGDSGIILGGGRATLSMAGPAPASGAEATSVAEVGKKK